MIAKRFKEYFTFTKKERNGLIVLVSILFIIVVINVYIKNKSYGSIDLTDGKFKKEVEQFENSLQPKQSNKKNKLGSYKRRDKNNTEWYIPETLFLFDPNAASKGQLKELGFSGKQINTLIKYRENGGQFLRKADLLKIYGIDETQYEILEPFIDLITEAQSNKDYKKQVKTKEIKELSIELNSTSLDELIQLSGIGDVFAKRIIKYRNLLGGFIFKEQLFEVYGIDTLTYNKISNHIQVDTTLIDAISINNADFGKLLRHPYLNKYQVQSLIKYRELTGGFKRIEQIEENNLLSKEELIKIKPYLKIE